jgi:hypothetical protein
VHGTHHSSFRSRIERAKNWMERMDVKNRVDANTYLRSKKRQRERQQESVSVRGRGSDTRQIHQFKIQIHHHSLLTDRHRVVAKEDGDKRHGKEHGRGDGVAEGRPCGVAVPEALEEGQALDEERVATGEEDLRRRGGEGSVMMEEGHTPHTNPQHKTPCITAHDSAAAPSPMPSKQSWGKQAQMHMHLGMSLGQA